MVRSDTQSLVICRTIEVCFRALEAEGCELTGRVEGEVAEMKEKHQSHTRETPVFLKPSFAA